MDIIRIGVGEKDRAGVEDIGAKAAILAQVAALGLPVPPAFVLPIALGAALLAGDRTAERKFIEGLEKGIAFLEAATGKSFGDRRRPLLVSVRSGAAQSMPGMLDSVLDIGCTRQATRGLIRMTGNPRFAWDCRRRLLEDYAETVLGLDPAPFFARRDGLVSAEGAGSDRDLDSEALERLAFAYERLLADADQAVPDEPTQQLIDAARSVYRSWSSDRASTYRRLQGLEHLKGTAVMVQAMVFGNRGSTSGAGVAFSRDPSTGGVEPVIELLFEAQGEDVVAGRRTPETEAELASRAPAIARQLRGYLLDLEQAFKDVQDVEFTIEDGRLWILQSRGAKRTARAQLRIAVDLVREGTISPTQALQRLQGLDLQTLAIARFVGPARPIAQGIGAAGGVAVGRAVFDSGAAKRLTAAGEPAILVRFDVDTADVAGLAAATGLCTATGGRTAHASLIARQLGKACVVSCKGLMVSVDARHADIDGTAIEEGDWISIDGDSGEVFLGQREVVRERPEAELAEVERWRAKAVHQEGQAKLALA